MNFKKNYPFLLLILLHLILLTQLKFTIWPEMILYPYFLLNDFTLYKDIINPYFPFLPIVLFGFFKLFGMTVFNLKLLTWLIILISDGTILYAAKHFFKKQRNRIISLVLFIVLQIYFGGNGLWFELMLTPFFLLSLTLIYFYPGNLRKIFLAGLFFSLAVLIKQNVLLFLIPISLYLYLNKWTQNLLFFFLATSSLLGVSAGIIFQFGVWNEFFTWAVKLPLSFTKLPGFVLLPALRQYPIILFPLVTLLPFLLSKKFKLNQKLFWLFSFLIALQFAFPRFENFHLQPLAALSSIFAPMMPKKYLVTFTGLVIVLFGIFFIKNFHQNDRFIDPAMLQLSEKIKDYQSVYILNGPELSYFFAGKLPPKPWASNFPWYFEYDNFENKFIESLRLKSPDAIVMGNLGGGDKYQLGNYIPEKLTIFINSNYNMTEKFETYTIWELKK